MTQFLLAPPFPRSAVMAAAARAAHLEVDAAPHLFADTLAARLLGPDGDEPLRYQCAYPDHPVLRAVRIEVTVRARFAEDLLAATDVRQYAVVGAGLDTYAYRADAGVRVFEVDRESAQAAKRAAAERAGLAGPVTYVPADLAEAPLDGVLREAGADIHAPLFVGALGLAMYLTLDEVAQLAAAAAAWPGGAHLVLDFMRPPHDEATRAHGEQIEAAAAAGGDPWVSRMTLEEAVDIARAAGFPHVRAVPQRDALPPALWDRSDGLRPAGTSALLHASTVS